METRDSQIIHLRLLIALLAVYAALYLVFFFYGVFSFPEKHFLPTFRARWTLNKAVLRFVSSLLTAHCTTVILTVSFSAKTSFSGSLNRTIGGLMVIFLISTVIYSVFVEGIEPAAFRKLSSLRYQTSVARIIFENASQAYDEGRYEDADRLIDYYRKVDPGNSEAAELKSFIIKRLTDSLGNEGDQGPAERGQGRLAELSPAELIELAEKYLGSEDIFSAYYYARLAMDVARRSGEAWQRADRIAAVATTRIESLELSETERANAQLYATKRNGIEALSSGEPARTIEAYYIFETLSVSYPDDAEVARYYSIASRAATEVTFFLDEAEAIRTMPGVRNIVFINSQIDSKLLEVVKIGKLVRLDTRVFVEDVEVLAFSGSELRYHYRAPFSEYVAGALLLRGIDRNNSDLYSAPEYLAGEPQDNDGTILAISPTLEQLLSFSSTSESYRDRGFFQMLEFSEFFPDFGYDVTPVKASALDRAVAPFTFFALSLLSVALAIRYLPDGGRPTLFSMILLPAVPVVVYGLIELYRYAMKLFNVFLATTFGLGAGLLLVAAGQLAVLIIVIFFLATSQALASEEN